MVELKDHMNTLIQREKEYNKAINEILHRSKSKKKPLVNLNAEYPA